VFRLFFPGFLFYLLSALGQCFFLHFHFSTTLYFLCFLYYHLWYPTFKLCVCFFLLCSRQSVAVFTGLFFVLLDFGLSTVFSSFSSIKISPCLDWCRSGSGRSSTALLSCFTLPACCRCFTRFSPTLLTLVVFSIAAVWRWRWRRRRVSTVSRSLSVCCFFFFCFCRFAIFTAGAVLVLLLSLY
jgi:hypothetical protein